MKKNRVDKEINALYIFTTLLLLFVLAIGGAPLFRTGKFADFAGLTGLIALVIALHWIGPSMVAKGRVWLYVGIHVVVNNAIAFLFLDMTLIPTLFAPLFGAAVGIFGTGRRAMTVMVIYLFSGFATFFIKDPANIIPFAVSTIILWTFVAIVVAIYARQHEERERSEKLAEKLQDANDQLLQSGARIKELTTAAERQRLARELHDTLAQGLSALVLQLEATKNHLENGNVPRAQEIVDRAMQRARETLADSRAAIDNLRAQSDGPITLEIALKRQTEKFRQTSGLPCKLTLGDSAGSVAPERIEEIEKIVSEALANVGKHAKATLARVIVAGAAGELLIEVRDDGIGFESSADPVEGQYGLIGMQERAELIGGSLSIERAPAGGTIARLILNRDSAPVETVASDV